MSSEEADLVRQQQVNSAATSDTDHSRGKSSPSLAAQDPYNHSGRYGGAEDRDQESLVRKRLKADEDEVCCSAPASSPPFGRVANRKREHVQRDYDDDRVSNNTGSVSVKTGGEDGPISARPLTSGGAEAEGAEKGLGSVVVCGLGSGVVIEGRDVGCLMVTSSVGWSSGFVSSSHSWQVSGMARFRWV